MYVSKFQEPTRHIDLWESEEAVEEEEPRCVSQQLEQQPLVARPRPGGGLGLGLVSLLDHGLQHLRARLTEDKLVTLS